MKHTIFPLPAALLCIEMLFGFSRVFSQPAAEDSFYLKALKNSMAVYHKSFGNRSALYNGSMYYYSPFNFEAGQPYFHTSEMTTGSVVYDDIFYDSVIIQYDEVADAVILQALPDRIQLRNEKVKNFHLYNADFIKRAPEQNTPGIKDPGFFNMLYKGKVNLLKKEIKTIREQIPYTGPLLMFVDTKEYYYIEKQNQLYAVSSIKDLYQILGAHKNEVKEHIKVNKLSFRKDRQNMLSRVITYYDSLK